jgi:AbrB family looped-hinge helix DNA binding protein
MGELLDHLDGGRRTDTPVADRADATHRCGPQRRIRSDGVGGCEEPVGGDPDLLGTGCEVDRQRSRTTVATETPRRSAFASNARYWSGSTSPGQVSDDRLSGHYHLTTESEGRDMPDVLVGKRAQVVIPAAIRRRLGWKEGDRLHLQVDERGRVILERVSDDPVDRLKRAGEAVFRGVDPLEEQRRLRDEWR